MSDGSDIKMQTALPKKPAKEMPKSPSKDILKRNEESEKPSTKVMLHQALTELKSRKGTSLYAIKKYIHEKFNVDVNKINYIIKKLIKAEVEAGTIVQTKGVGASGSFKLVVGKENVQNKKLVEKSKGSEEKTKKPKDTQEKPKAENLEKKIKTKDGGTTKKTSSKVKPKEKGREENVKEETEEKKKPKASKSKSAKVVQTPAKKRTAMLKRKSIGSIIKPPKMRPKAKA